MKLVEWCFQNLKVPMVEIKGALYCTNKGLCDALQINDATLRSIYHRHTDEFDSKCVAICNAIDFFKEHKGDFDLKYVPHNRHRHV